MYFGDADKQSAKALLGSFAMNRSVSECSNIAEIFRVNQNALSENELKKIKRCKMCSSYKNRTNSERHRCHSCRYKFRTVF